MHAHALMLDPIRLPNDVQVWLRPRPSTLVPGYTLPGGQGRIVDCRDDKGRPCYCIMLTTGETRAARLEHLTLNKEDLTMATLNLKKTRKPGTCAAMRCLETSVCVTDLGSTPETMHVELCARHATVACAATSLASAGIAPQDPLPNDPATDPMLASLGDCQSPPVAKIRAELQAELAGDKAPCEDCEAVLEAAADGHPNPEGLAEAYAAGQHICKRREPQPATAAEVAGLQAGIAATPPSALALMKPPAGSALDVMRSTIPEDTAGYGVPPPTPPTLEAPLMQANLAAEAAELNEALELVKTYEIVDQSDVDFAKASDKDAAEQIKTLEARRKKATGPMNEALREVNSWFKPATSALEAIRAEWKRKLVAHIEKAAAEQARLAEAARAAATAGDMPAVRTALVAASSAAPDMKGMSVLESWAFDIVDPAALPREYLCPDLAKIQAVVNAMKGQTNIPGVVAKMVTDVRQTGK